MSSNFKEILEESKRIADEIQEENSKNIMLTKYKSKYKKLKSKYKKLKKRLAKYEGKSHE